MSTDIYPARRYAVKARSKRTMTRDDRSASGLVLSLFPGIGMLDYPFAEAGYCVVRGPDVMYQGDIRDFHAPPGHFDGVIGGPPCQAFSRLRFLVEANGHSPRFGDMMPEFARVVRESRPLWWVMENVPQAPTPNVGDGYSTHVYMLSDHASGGLTIRKRMIVMGVRGVVNDWPTPVSAPITTRPYLAVTRKPIRCKENGRCVILPVREMLRRQGFPEEFLSQHCGLTKRAQRQAAANGVPLAMGREIVRLLQAALTLVTERRDRGTRTCFRGS